MIDYTREIPSGNSDYDLMCLALDPDMTRKEIEEVIQKSMPICKNKAQGFVFSLGGFDEDPRELWQIPKAIKFMKMIMDIGFMSVLEVSTMCVELMPERFKGIGGAPGLGALELWVCANNRMHEENLDISNEMMKEFLADLNESNNKVEKLCQQPTRNELKETTISFVKDGQVKYEGFPK